MNEVVYEKGGKLRLSILDVFICERMLFRMSLRDWSILLQFSRLTLSGFILYVLFKVIYLLECSNLTHSSGRNNNFLGVGHS